MQENVAKCGADCKICPWSRSVQDSMTKEQYQEFCKNCKETISYSPTGQYQNCVGCQTPEENWPENARIPLRQCTIRLCVIKNEIENCAYCSRFPCEFIGDKADEWARKNIEKKRGKPVSNENYQKYILAFERFSRLKKIHESLTPNQMVEPKTVFLNKNKIVKFPEKLELPNEDLNSLKNLHQLLTSLSGSSLDMKDVDIFAPQKRLKARIKHLQRFLWIIGTFSVRDEESDSLQIDASSYGKNRQSEASLGDYSFLVDFVVKILLKFGVIVEPKSLTSVLKGKNGWVTPTGALRNKNWQMKVSFSEEIGGKKTLYALQDYCQKLDVKYGKKSFGFFVKTDMRVFEK